METKIINKYINKELYVVYMVVSIQNNVECQYISVGNLNPCITVQWYMQLGCLVTHANYYGPKLNNYKNFLFINLYKTICEKIFSPFFSLKLFKIVWNVNILVWEI